MSEENLEIVRRLYQSWRSGTFMTPEAVGTFSPEVEFARIGSAVVGGKGGPGRWRGLEEMANAVGEWVGLWEEFQIETDDFIDCGDRVLVLTRQTARGKLSSSRVETELADLITLRDSKIVRFDSYWDRSEALEAAGL